MKKGTHHSEETKQKISKSEKGKKVPDNIKIKISQSHKGKKCPWSKNNHQTFKKGRIPWNKNKKYKTKPPSQETRNKISRKLMGHKHSEETLKKMRKPHKPFTEEQKQKMKEAKINNPNRKFKETSIELKIEIELLRRGINYQKQVPLCKIAIVDFYLPEYRIVIQCDGDYWHNRPGAKERDERQDKVLTFNGFNVYRFWQHEINESPEKCINKLFQQNV